MPISSGASSPVSVSKTSTPFFFSKFKEERQRILQDAQKEANDIIKEAENKIIGMIDEHEITKKAYEQRTEIIDAAEKYKRDLIAATREHADTILEELEKQLKDNLDMIRSNRKELK